VDVISNGEPAPRSNRRTAAWALVVVVAVAGLYGLRHLTENRDPAQSAPAAAAATPTPAPVEITVDPESVGLAVVPVELSGKVLLLLPEAQVMGGLDLVGSKFPNGNESIGVEEDSLPGKGRYDVTVVCLGTGGADVTLMDPAKTQRGARTVLRLVCTGRTAKTTIELSRPRLQIVLYPDPETLGSFGYSVAYAVVPAKA
jgi:hypothetical protein